jgi:hypothetical protein
MIRALPRLEGGRILLDVRNGEGQTVMVQSVVGLQDTQSTRLSNGAFIIDPGESITLDISSGLIRLIQGPERSGVRIRILLALGPEVGESPRTQSYLVSCDMADQFTSLSAFEELRSLSATME